MLGKAAERFIRTRWKSTQHLAEELYAIFTDTLPLTHSGPITITPNHGGPAITITMPPESEVPPIETEGGGEGEPGEPGEPGGGGGGQNLNEIVWPGNPERRGVPDPADNPVLLFGIVRGKLGADLYRVECWAMDPDTADSVAFLEVKQMLIDPDDTIPIGSPVCPVIAYPGLVDGRRTIVKAIMQVPVFLAEVV